MTDLYLDAIERTALCGSYVSTDYIIELVRRARRLETIEQDLLATFTLGTNGHRIVSRYFDQMRRLDSIGRKP